MNARTSALIARANAFVRKEPASACIPSTSSEPNEEYLTDNAIMEWLGVNAQWLADHRTRVEPIIPHVKLGSIIRYPKAAIQAWLDAQMVTQPRWDRTRAS